MSAGIPAALVALWADCAPAMAADLARYAVGGDRADMGARYLRGVLRACDEAAAMTPDAADVLARAAAVEASRAWLVSVGALPAMPAPSVVLLPPPADVPDGDALAAWLDGLVASLDARHVALPPALDGAAPLPAGLPPRPSLDGGAL